MAAAQLPEPTPVLKKALRQADASTFQHALFDWVEKAATVRPTTLWLLNDSFDALSQFAAYAPPILMDDALRHRFRQQAGAWMLSLDGGARQVFSLPFGDEEQTRGLLEFTHEASGLAWRRTAVCLIQVYLAQRHQRQEHMALEAMLMQVRKGQKKRGLISLKTGHLAALKTQFERTLIADRLDTFGQAKTATAQSLGITYRSLAQKCKQLGLS